MSEKLSIGTCVILNDCDQPCGRLVAVVTDIDPQRVYCKYLNTEGVFDRHNRGSGMAIDGCMRDEITPIEDFSVRLRVENDGSDIMYWCEIIGESIATYRDGQPRQWQERGWRGRYVARRDVLRSMSLQEHCGVDA